MFTEQITEWRDSKNKIKEFKKKDSDLKLVCDHIENNLGPISSIIDKRSSINKKSRSPYFYNSFFN